MTRIFGALVLTASVMLGAPARSQAQNVTPAALMGGWAKQGQTQVYLTFNADSTISVPALSARWHLAGDTLVVDTILRSSRRITPAQLWRTVSLSGNELTLTEITGAKTARVYVRAGADSTAAMPATP